MPEVRLELAGGHAREDRLREPEQPVRVELAGDGEPRAAVLRREDVAAVERDGARDAPDRRARVRLVLGHLPADLDADAEELPLLAYPRAHGDRAVGELLRLAERRLPEPV